MRQADDTAAEPGALRGSNQSAMRAYNERLVLSLVRRSGALAKSDIARMTGLSAQTVSVIMRGLEADGLLLRGEPVRGRIGQPSVPMLLAARGAYFLGLKIGRRSVDLVLVDFLGAVVGRSRQTYPYPLPDRVVDFVRGAVPQLVGQMAPGLRGRVAGLGIAMPFQLWQWAQTVGAPQADMDAWRGRDIQSEIEIITGLPVFAQNDASAACGAELVFGSGERAKDFLYFYVGHFIGGGLVLNGQLFTGSSGNAAALGSMPVPSAGGEMRQLIDLASLASLERRVERRGGDGQQLWESPVGWTLPPGALEEWVAEAGQALAHAVLSAAAVIDLQAVLIDGWLSAGLRRQLTDRTRQALMSMDLVGIDPPDLREGTIGPDARTLGAAAIPLSLRYLLDQSALLSAG